MNTETTIRDLINKVISDILNPFIVLLFGVAIVIFVWGIIQYVIGSKGDTEALHKARGVILWGIIGMFIMVSAWGIIYMLCDFFEFTDCGS